MSNDDLIYSLARQCARGTRQLSFVNELLSWNEVRAEIYRPPSVKPDVVTMVFGQSRLPRSSWTNLKRRLVGAGFIIAEKKYQDPFYLSVALDHPARWTR